jgi:hypothetical protein
MTMASIERARGRFSMSHTARDASASIALITDSLILVTPKRLTRSLFGVGAPLTND